MIGFGHRPTAITILGRVTPVLDLWPVSPLLLMSRRPPFAKRLVDPPLCLGSEFGTRNAYLERWFLSVTGERLRRPTPATIEQRICRSNASVRSVALSHFLEQALDSLSRMVSGKFPNHCDLPPIFRSTRRLNLF